MSWSEVALGLKGDWRTAELAESRLGRLSIWVTASALLVWHEVPLVAPLALGLIWLAPAHRRTILSLAAVAMVVDHYLERQRAEAGLSAILSLAEAPAPWLKAGAFVVCVLAGLYVLFLCARRLDRFPRPVRQHPLLAMHCGLVVAFGLMMAFPGLVAAAELVPWLTWRASYLLQLGARGGVKGTRFFDHLFYLWPVVANSGSPYGKGFAYLSSREAKNDGEMASSQLAGIKLLVLATLWELLLRLFDVAVFRDPAVSPHGLPAWNLGLPTMLQAIVAGNLSTAAAWVTILLELLRIVLYYAVLGHLAIGFLRLAGFNIFRNTYKPLLSESIVEFWGRFNYYFKEAMVDFFFYPTFLKCRGLPPRVRLFLAVFAAAFVGNMYYHMLIAPELIIAADIAVLWEVWGPRTVYCCLLSIGVWASMLRQQSARRSAVAKSAAQRLRAMAGVWLFYATIHIWNLNGEGLTWANRFDFCLKLIGIQTPI